MKKIVTVTVAVSAYNEAKNIRAFLNSVIQQKQVGYVLEKILVISDGSRDKTVLEAKKVKSPLIKIIEHEKRVGKSTHLNTIYQDLKSDILVQSDCDVIFADPLTIYHLIAPLKKQALVGMVGGNPMPVKGKGFIEKAINVSVEPFLNFRKKINKGSNVFSADGRLLAFKKEIVQNITVPSNMIANDMYAYFACLSQQSKYAFAEKAVVLFRSPQNLKDHVRQNTRFRAAPFRMQRHFSKELVSKELAIPYMLYIRELFYAFIQHPILSIFIYTINVYCRIKARITEYKLTAKWDMAISTKNI